MATVKLTESTGITRFYKNIDDVDFVQGICHSCDIGQHCSECPKDCFEYLGRGDGVLVLIRDGQAHITYDNDDWKSYKIIN